MEYQIVDRKIGGIAGSGTRELGNGRACKVGRERPLARMLLLLSHFGKEGAPQTIVPNISQETLADMIGTTRSRVSHFMNKFRKLGLISYNGHIEVNSAMLDAVLHDQPELREDE